MLYRYDYRRKIRNHIRKHALSGALNFCITRFPIVRRFSVNFFEIIIREMLRYTRRDQSISHRKNINQ